MTFDLMIKGGWVIDGTGGPPYRADVAVLESMIAEVGRLDGVEAARVLDATGRYVVPGFIDAHVHGDLMLLADPIHLPALRQGVTTYLIGQDGSSFAPASPATLDYMRRYTAGFNGNPPGLSYDWRTVDEYLARFDRSTAINVAYLIPNGNVRMEVMGLDPRPATEDELRAMQKLVREGMDAGAIGLSTGLDYIPSLYADAREIAALCEPMVAENGVYVTHMRGYGPRADVGMREVYDIARMSGIPAHISHYNGPADLLLPLIDEGRALGLDLTYDTYPYLAGSTILGMVAACRSWVQIGGIDATVDRLRDPAVRRPVEVRMVLGSDPLSARTDHDRHGRESRLGLGRGNDRHGGGRAGEARPGRLRLRDPVRLGSGRGHRGVPPGRPDRGRRPRDPAASGPHGGLRRHLPRRIPPPPRLGAMARYLGYHTRQLGDYSWPEAVTTPRDPRRPPVPTDRPRLDPPRIRRRHRRLRPGHRHRPLDLRRRARRSLKVSITYSSMGHPSSSTVSPPAMPRQAEALRRG